MGAGLDISTAYFIALKYLAMAHIDNLMAFSAISQMSAWSPSPFNSVFPYYKCPNFHDNSTLLFRDKWNICFECLCIMFHYFFLTKVIYFGLSFLYIGSTAWCVCAPDWKWYLGFVNISFVLIVFIIKMAHWEFPPALCVIKLVNFHWKGELIAFIFIFPTVKGVPSSILTW